MNLHNIILIILLINFNKIYCFFNINKINNLSNYNIKNTIKKQYLYRNEIQYKIIYNKYEKFALSKAIEFKNKYNLYLKNNDEIFMYSRIGLHKAIINFNYNENTSFFSYMDKYINGELYNFISDKYPISIIPAYIRKNTKIQNKNKNYKLLPVLFYDNWYLDKIKNNEYEYYYNSLKNLWNLIYNNLDSNSYLIFKNKYDYNFNIIRSNLNISKSLGVNEEYIRLNLLKSKNIIKNKLEER